MPRSPSSPWILLLAVAAAGAAALPASATAGGARRSLTLREVAHEPAMGDAAVDQTDIDALAAAVAANPDQRKAHFLLVRGLRKAGRLAEAVEAANRWRTKDAYNLVVVRLLGDLYMESGDRDKALRTYSAVVELLPKDPAAQRALAGVLKQTGQMEAARQRLAAAVKLRPDDRRLRFELADATQRTGQLDQARALFESITSDASVPPAVRYPAKQRLAQIYNQLRRQSAQQGDSAEATRLQRAIDELEIKGGSENDIKVYLTWDTDRSDVDLHVTNPAGETVMYSHRQGRFGGTLFDDVTTGYGPESFTANTAATGIYEIKVNYFSAGGGNFAEARGEVVVILNEGSDNERKHVIPYRLFEAKQTITVAHIEVR